ncbi:nucleoid-associated protein [Brevibacillus agri]|uniref:nucleoid-associated protein n=1 Tax=Brevibacillus agri TaxID=51101 RepID=UPI002E1F7AF1|nr:nucleoid-associated protein [Brevibacillus agri]MED1657864.1 nucleoid-associated protein [Brevibacillus agri]MED1690148.1 nucleoid-associated protein [Brevibacillus agri]MED1695325.1 nucleoid-associated protein [Brevibacillus agri]MED1700793.1 nucleoid-associated protein [Brevibacillus agri]
MTVDFTGVNIDRLMVHGIGNKLKEESVVLSEQCVDVQDKSLASLLGKFFFQHFKDNGVYHFGHINNLKFNQVYQYVKSIFENLDSFEACSQNIAKHLYEVSTHPNIKKGELYIAYLKGAALDGVIYDAIGIFKSETKDAYLRIKNTENRFSVDWEQGVDTNKLDKGCIVFNNLIEKGYNVILIDTASHIDAKYWVEDFLGIEKNNNNYHKTKILIDACKEFTKKDFIEGKPDKIALLNNVVEYIKSNPNIELDEFTYNVAEKLNRSEELKEFISDFAEKKECRDIGNFSIDKSAMKNIKRSLKNFIKLDTNIEIKINVSSGSDMTHLEKGYDDTKKMYFYKIYFNREE